MHGDAWSQRDDKILECASTVGLPDRYTAELLSRSTSALQARRCRLHIGRYDSKTWSPEEEAILARSYPLHSFVEIRAALPKRSQSAIRSHAYERGLQRYDGAKNRMGRIGDERYWSPGELELLRQAIMEEWPWSATKALLGRTVKAIWLKAAYLGLHPAREDWYEPISWQPRMRLSSALFADLDAADDLYEDYDPEWKITPHIWDRRGADDE